MLVKDDATYDKSAEAQSHRNEQPEYADAPPPYEEIASSSSFVIPTPESRPSASPPPLDRPVETQQNRQAERQQGPGKRSPSRYAPAQQASSSSLRQNSAPPPSPPLSRPPQDRTVNSLSLYSRNDPLSGTYYIDPALASPTGSSQTRRDRSTERAHGRNVREAFGAVPGEEEDGNESDASDRRGWLRRSSMRRPGVNAAFRTRSGNIKATLRIVESETAARAAALSKSAARKVRARAMLSSRHGGIEARIAEIHPTRCIDLDVSTRDSDIAVFLPVNFNGLVAFRSRRGTTNITFLPAFAGMASVVRGNNSEMLVSLSPSTVHTDASTPREGEDYCVIGTREGRIKIGLYGQDEEAAVAQSGGVGGLVSALVGIGFKSAATIVQASTNLGMSTVQATVASARDSAMLVKDHALNSAARARMSAVDGGRQARGSAMQVRAQFMQAKNQMKQAGSQFRGRP